MNIFYYQVKPFLPRALRVLIRRRMARRKRAASCEIWPIDERAARVPEGWPGWPGGKRFGVVLSHDVEGPTGVAKCRDLARLEARAGFQSSFNFIPEGGYRVTRELREELGRQGFEVGVHDLRHDGHLYRSRAEFAANAKRINLYLKEWGACGFRSGFMLHNLDWIADLDVAYDASTFDTDPFEPQPDGARTIFPFWGPRPNGTGYVERPYTLAQDSTLFIYLQERTIEVWKRKLEWVAARGGMALVNVHPDYMCFGGGETPRYEFQTSLYEELLAHIRDQYDGQYWHGLPREVARFVRAARGGAR